LREDDTSTSTTEPFGTTTFTTPTFQTPSARTDGAGRVRYELRCEREGNPNLALRVPVRSAPPVTTDPTATTFEAAVTLETFSLELPACVDPATLTTTTAQSFNTTTTEG
jgi:hypothetical protein